MVDRVTFRRRNPYNTRSNKIKVVKTPGGKLRAQHIKKKGTSPKCPECGGKPLQGVKALRPREYASAPRRHKTVQRAYGGSICSGCVKDRIIRAFIVEEQKIVKHVIAQRDAEEKKKQAAASKKSKKA